MQYLLTKGGNWCGLFVRHGYSACTKQGYMPSSGGVDVQFIEQCPVFRAGFARSITLGAERMRPEFLGDSYDVVKRFFCTTLRSLGYTVYIDPLFTGAWAGQEADFYRFLGVESFTGAASISVLTALFIDPDTGVNEKGSLTHVPFERLCAEAESHSIVFVFDQAFSRGGNTESKLQAKLDRMTELNCSALYYASHAHFLFVSRCPEPLQRLRDELLALGLPASRLIEAAPDATAERGTRKSKAP